MVKVILTNNANVREIIVDAAQPVRTILENAGFTYAGATLNIQGIACGDLDAPLSYYTNGASEVRITAVAHKANA